ncbi:MAG: S41 family peptidase [Crocinitomicaceae bacterium]|nr:S41 family peptidase [Crocinitomicaceae bacterium]MDG1775834.1 S41 family peptidase [Crocinitomicaceae bacterium]
MFNFSNPIRVALVILSLTFTAPSFSQSNGFEVVRSLELLDQIYEHLEKYYVDDLETGKMAKTAIDAMLKELDPYTVYYHESNIEDYQLMTTGQYGGIGSLIQKHENFVYISEPYKGKPAEKAGLKAGDKILEIDGKDMENKSSADVSAALKGPKGTNVKIKVVRNFKDIKTITVARDEIKLPDVPYSGMLNETTGYIKLNSFTHTASSNVKSAFAALKKQGMKELVLDLRGNGGGLLIESVRIVNMFIEKDQLVVSTKGRVIEENNVYKTMNAPMDLEIPLVVLVDQGSASASEIVSGSLQDLDRAVIIGTQSFGKGLVQRTYDLNYGSKIKLTIAKYYTPSGRCVQRLEYYDNAHGDKALEIPDSLVTIFKTKNGRPVIDGRGIDPDIAVELNDLSRLTATIYRNHLFFDFATQYYYAHDSISEAATFELSNEEYEAFKDYVLDQEFTYSTASEEMLNRMKKTAEQEGFFKDSEAAFNALMEKVTPSKERDLTKFKTQIKSMLENEIISRYHHQSGRAQHAFKDDPFIKKSLEILQDNSQYNTILKN